MLFNNDMLLWFNKMGISEIYLGDTLIYRRKSSWFTVQLKTN